MNIRVIFFILIFFGFSFKLFSDAKNVSLIDFEKIGTYLKTTMVECPQKIWPDYNLKSFSVLMKTDQQQPVAWKGWSPDKVTPLLESELPKSAFLGRFDFFDFDYHPGMSVLGDSEDFTDRFFRFIVHEAFHRLGQKLWTHPKYSNSHTQYPISKVPRLYRRMMYERLKEYYFSPDHKSLDNLKKSAYWFQKWKSEFPREFFNITDNREGSARYMDLISLAVAEEGCQITESQLYDKTIKLMKADDQFTFFQGSSRELRSESYALGALALATIRFITKDSAWYEQIKQGRSPLEILFEKITPLSDVIPDDLEKKYEIIFESKNKEIADWIEPDMNLFNSESALRIFIIDSMTTTFSPKGFFEKDEFELTPIRKSVVYEGYYGSIKVFADKVLFQSKEINPCSETPDGNSMAGTIAVVSLDSVVFSQKDESQVSTDGSQTFNTGRSTAKIQLHGSGLEGFTTGTLKTDKNGLKWFCQTPF